MLVGFRVLGEGKMWGGGCDGASLAYPKLRRAGAVHNHGALVLLFIIKYSETMA